MLIDKIKQYKYYIFIFILPFLCFITRKFSKPLYENPLQELNSKSFFGNMKFKNRNILKVEEINKLKTNNNTRLFIKANDDGAVLYFTFSKYKYYDDYNFSFTIDLNLNNSELITNNYSLIYSEDYLNNSKIVKFKENKGIFNTFSKPNEISLNNISFKYIKINTNFECVLTFEDFDLFLNLQKEIFTFKFYNLIIIIVDILTSFCIFGNDFWENNFQNINELFAQIMFNKVTIINLFHIYDLFQIGLPIIKLIYFYPHLLIYGEFILSISDIFSMTLIAFYALFSFVFSYLKIELERNFFYCFNNQIVNNQIIIKESRKIINYQNQIIFLSLSIFNFSSSIYVQSIPIILGLVLSIIKQLYKREVMCNNNKNFYINFYYYSTLLYAYYLLVFNFGEFYKRKPTYAVAPFVIIFALYRILSMIVKNEYKISSVMIKDFEKLKKIDKDVCSICLRNFNYDENKTKKYLCKISEEENIHETSCNHYFHEKCLFNWRKYGNICPNCKTPLDIPDYYFFFDETPCLYKPDWLLYLD